MTPTRTEILLKEAARLTGVSVARILGEERGQEAVKPRTAVIWVMREHFGLSLPKIGKLLGDRDHTTILMASRRGERWRKSDAGFLSMCGQLEAVLETNEDDQYGVGA